VKWEYVVKFGLAMMSRLRENTGLFYRISSLVWGSFAKETYDLKEPSNRSHPIVVCRKEETYQVSNEAQMSSDSISTKAAAVCICVCV